MRYLKYIVAITLLLSAPAGAQLLLTADFDDKPLDLPIGTNGPGYNEPISVDAALTAIVRSSPMPTPSLELQDNDDFYSGSARFEFLDGQVAGGDKLRVELDVWLPDTSSGLQILVREAGSASLSFATIHFTPYGSIWASDAAGTIGVLGSYQTDTVLHITLIFNLKTQCWDLLADGQLLLNDRHNGVSGSIGAVLVGVGPDDDLIGTSYVDNLRVEKGLLFDGFESGDFSAWSGSEP